MFLDKVKFIVSTWIIKVACYKYNCLFEYPYSKNKKVSVCITMNKYCCMSYHKIHEKAFYCDIFKTFL
ncbi:hypothetical protein HERIO_644 [Hepatospora eriocheir]|uniref:Uncharacterized protein n=1 Tax=Hepatospora eriocheir TaxID=1081669 RepID=A0A1X0QCQ4_9MICR|nr:hypothetical protein HERIO_644 [Hepatospora eriocheir]